MKTNILLLFSSLLFLVSCNSKEKTELNIPWYIQGKITKDRSFTFEYKEIYDKIKVLDTSEISNLGTYYSYLANLTFKQTNPNILEAKKLLEIAFQLDSVGICNNLILDSYKYVLPDGRPNRRATMPYILDLDIDLFIEKLKQCEHITNIQGYDFNTNLELELRMSYIMLKDQWYRNPRYKRNPEVQIQFDIENRQSIDELHQSFDLSKPNEEIRSDIYILLLHSIDCDWSLKWMKIYINIYKGHDKLASNLTHFLDRTACSDQELTDLVGNTLKQI